MDYVKVRFYLLFFAFAFFPPGLRTRFFLKEDPIGFSQDLDVFFVEDTMVLGSRFFLRIPGVFSYKSRVPSHLMSDGLSIEIKKGF